MEPNLKTLTYEIQKIGKAALESISAGHAGTVMAVVTRAAYLLDDRDELLWLTAAPGPMHRRCLQVSSSIPRLTVGTSYQVHDHCLATSSGEKLDFNRSMVWESPAIPLEKVVAAAKLSELVDSVYGRLLEQHEPAGWGRWITTVRTGGRLQDNGQETRPASLPGPAAESILLACRSHDPLVIPRHAAELIGRGEGLTPSGDDFLGGLLFCLHLLRTVYPMVLDTSWNYSTFIQQCKPRTNLISYTFLKDHAEGHALEPLHRFANALLQSQPLNYILPFAEDLIQVGHSTGWDLLTGFLVGLTVIFPQ